MLKTNLCVRNSTKSQTPDANLFDFGESFVIQCEGNLSLSFHEDWWAKIGDWWENRRVYALPSQWDCTIQAMLKALTM
jgi:hypothetical protein